MATKETFFQYLRDNGIWLFIAWLALLGLFIIYWITSSSWEEAKLDIFIALGVTGGILIVWLVGDIICFRKL